MSRLLVGALSLSLAVSVGCATQKAPAELSVKSLGDAMAAAKPEIEKFAGGQWAPINDGMASVQKKLTDGDYAGVLADVPAVTTQLSEATQAAAAKKAELTDTWAASATMPALVGQVSARLTELSAMKRLPVGMDKSKLDDAKASLESVNKLWADASAASQSGDLVTAVAKANAAKPMVTLLMSTLGIVTPAA